MNQPTPEQWQQFLQWQQFQQWQAQNQTQQAPAWQPQQQTLPPWQPVQTQPWQQPHVEVVHKENVHLTASTVRAGIIGMAQAQMRATLTDLNGQGIAGERVTFVVTSTRQEFGSAVTNDQGEAVLDSGANISDPQIWVSAGSSGFTAIYGGNEKYKSQEAKGKFQIAI
ncbi:Ig-like domain-containing protein [Streptomyces cinnamoneus]|uniref:Ig-like domain-containing protein n=1 Tax=Streptomyces cinnamoneus TaxID=53446 RepID=UPI0034408D2E